MATKSLLIAQEETNKKEEKNGQNKFYCMNRKGVSICFINMKSEETECAID